MIEISKQNKKVTTAQQRRLAEIKDANGKGKNLTPVM